MEGGGEVRGSMLSAETSEREPALLCAAVRCPGCAGQRQEHNNNDECCPMFYFPE